MNQERTRTQVVYTNKARCRDCYRCLRSCPVKAIRMRDGQAYVEEDRCIACGTCIRECPQEAKSYRRDIEVATALVQGDALVAVTVAPSFASYYGPADRKRLPSALRALGFRHVAETSVGAFPVALQTLDFVQNNPRQGHICTACPAVVSYVEHYEPDLSENLVPVASPMIAHARAIKRRFGHDSRVVFIGPCVAKKAEAARPEFEGVVDCALTFDELEEWFEREGVVLDQCEESGFDEVPAGESRFFPVPGGLMRTAAPGADLLNRDVIAASGVDDVLQGLDSVRTAPGRLVLEPLFCAQGCVNGPGMPTAGNRYQRRNDLIGYASEGHLSATRQVEFQPADLAARYSALQIDTDAFTEEQIADVLRGTGKHDPENQLNCGACGYRTCRENAVAVLAGMAEAEMCIPHMRRLAERRTDRIIETSPNGIVILDDHLRIISMNPAFRKMFLCSDAVLSKPVSYLVDPAPFERLAASGNGPVTLTARHDNYHLVCHQIVYALPEENQYVGIFVNITRRRESEEQLQQLRDETLRHAQELMEHQVEAAQHMAKLLGENTARSEELVRKLFSISSEKAPVPGDNWLWNTDTSK